MVQAKRANPSRLNFEPDSDQCDKFVAA